MLKVGTLDLKVYLETVTTCADTKEKIFSVLRELVSLVDQLKLRKEDAKQIARKPRVVDHTGSVVRRSKDLLVPLRSSAKWPKLFPGSYRSHYIILSTDYDAKICKLTGAKDIPRIAPAKVARSDDNYDFPQLPLDPTTIDQSLLFEWIGNLLKRTDQTWQFRHGNLTENMCI